MLGETHPRWDVRLKRIVIIAGKGRSDVTASEARTIGKMGFQEFTQVCRDLELWNGIQLFECGSERIRKTPDRPRPEFLILRLEVQVVHGAGEVLGGFEFTLHKCLVDDNL